MKELLYTFNGAIGTAKALLAFAPYGTILKRATEQEITAWKKVNQ